MTEKVESRVSFMQYFNTVLITLVLAMSGFIFTKVELIEQRQNEAAQELVRLKAVQDINVKNVSSLGERVYSLEMDNTEKLKKWIDENYKRKEQK